MNDFSQFSSSTIGSSSLPRCIPLGGLMVIDGALIPYDALLTNRSKNVERKGGRAYNHSRIGGITIHINVYYDMAVAFCVCDMPNNTGIRQPRERRASGSPSGDRNSTFVFKRSTGDIHRERAVVRRPWR